MCTILSKGVGYNLVIPQGVNLRLTLRVNSYYRCARLLKYANYIILFKLSFNR